MAITITEMKRRNPQWFSKESMRFFNTRIEARPNVKGYFITSEYMDNPEKARYTIRWFNPETNKVETVGDFQAYATLEEARQARKKL